jgi:hypothetical protein
MVRTDFSYSYFLYKHFSCGTFRTITFRKSRFVQHNFHTTLFLQLFFIRKVRTKNNCTEQLYEKFVRTTIVRKVILPRYLYGLLCRAFLQHMVELARLRTQLQVPRFLLKGSMTRDDLMIGSNMKSGVRLPSSSPVLTKNNCTE